MKLTSTLSLKSPTSKLSIPFAFSISVWVALFVTPKVPTPRTLLPVASAYPSAALGVAVSSLTVTNAAPPDAGVSNLTFRLVPSSVISACSMLFRASPSVPFQVGNALSTLESGPVTSPDPPPELSNTHPVFVALPVCFIQVPLLLSVREAW